MYIAYFGDIHTEKIVTIYAIQFEPQQNNEHKFIGLLLF